MRLRFSLRTLWIATTLVAVGGYFWLVRPTQIAQSFAAAVAAEDYPAADRFFTGTNKCLAKWADEQTAFRTQARLHPLSFGQLLSGRRYVAFQVSYFEFDSTAVRRARLTATPFGLSAPNMSTKEYTETFFIDSKQRYERGEPVEVKPVDPPPRE
jgi:hypothetical protein